MNYVIGTRGSKLALAQTEYVKKKLEQTYPADSFSIKIIQTKGDLITDRPLGAIGDKGLFVAAIEEQLLSGEIDLAVHSMKDMPGELPEELTFADAWSREDPRDVLLLRTASSLDDLKEGAVIGTGSLRRAKQLGILRPDVRVIDIRGNVDTRIRKMNEQKLDGIILAAAGIRRLHREDEITQYLEITDMLPAPAQGILAIEIHKKNKELLQKINRLSDHLVQLQAKTERTFLEEIGADCHKPIGAYAQIGENDTITLRVVFGNDTLFFAKAEGNHPEAVAKEAARSIRSQMAGCVYLLGAGPGDAGLLTIKGKELLEKADCIVYDRLVSPELLSYAKKDCELIYVGKENHHHTLSQEQIQAVLVEKAMQYQCVVRLKGGDPYVFGRGGEEGIYLKEHGISFEVIPGISSAIAGLASAKIPITHRGVATGFHVVTAHSKDDTLTELDFKTLTDEKETCVVLMGLRLLREVTERFIEAGRARTTKAAVISHATTAQQRCVFGTLETIADEVEAKQLTSPALIVIGDVVGLHEKLEGTPKKPLSGKRYLVPKIGRSRSRLGDLLREQGAVVDEVMVGTICYNKESCLEENFPDWVIFTSKHGVQGFFEMFQRQNMDMRKLAGTKFAVIGEKTNSALKKYGIYADFMPKTANGRQFAKEFGALVKPTDSVWYPKARNAVDTLLALGDCCEYQAFWVYENQTAACFWKKEAGISYDAVFFTCASSAKRLLLAAEDTFVQSLGNTCRVYAIGQASREALLALQVTNIIVPEQTSYEAMVEYEVEKWQDMPM